MPVVKGRNRVYKPVDTNFKGIFTSYLVRCHIVTVRELTQGRRRISRCKHRATLSFINFSLVQHFFVCPINHFLIHKNFGFLMTSLTRLFRGHITQHRSLRRESGLSSNYSAFLDFSLNRRKNKSQHKLSRVIVFEASSRSSSDGCPGDVMQIDVTKF